MKKNIKTKLHYLIAPALVITTFLIIIFIKDISPFGKNLIASLNMDSVYMPAYYKLYDVLHGTASIFYDYNLGGGTSPFGLLVANGLLSPISWLVYFVSRNDIPYFMTFIVLFKLVVISFTSYYALSKMFKNTGKLYNALFSIIYTLSGYTILMYSNVIWLENVALLPLIVLGLKNIFENKKSKLFIISLVLSLIYNYQITFIIMLFVLIMTALEVFIIGNKNKKEIIVKVITYMIISLLISSFALLPCIIELQSSYSLTNSLSDSFFQEKLIYFFPTALIIVLFFKQILNMKNDKKYSIFYLLLFLANTIGVILPGINKILNIGSYSNMPFKYGFIPIFVMILGSMHYLNNNKEIKNKVNEKFVFLAFIILNIFLIYIFNIFKSVTLDSNLSINIEYNKQFIALIIMFIINLSIIIVLNLLRNDDFKKYLLIYSTIISIVIFGYFAISVSEISSTLNAERMITNLSSISDNIYRYKDNTLSLGPNSSEILRVPINSSFTTSKTKQNYKSNYRLGYLTEGTSTYSSGGTIFSDLITANKYIISYQKLPDSLYTLIKEENDIYYYESKYNLSFVIPYFGASYSNYSDSIFNYQNSIYKKLFDKKDNIIDITKPNLELNNIKVTDENFYYPTKEDSSIKFSVKANSLSNIYLNLDIEYGNIYVIKVNGETLKNPTLTNIQNNTYPISDQTMVLLGQFENQEVTVELKTNGVVINNYQVGQIDISKFINLVGENKENITITSSMSTMTINYDNQEKNKSLLIPINYSNNYTITRNGKKIAYTSNFNDYVSVDLKSGKNDIVIKYKPRYFVLSIYGTIISIMILNLFSYINKKFNISNTKIIGNIFLFIFYFVLLSLFLKIYVLPLF